MTNSDPSDQVSQPGRAVPRHPAELGVGVVGAGRVGTALAAALSRAGHRIVAVSAVSQTSLRRVEKILPGTPVRPPEEVVASADLVLLTVPDDVLPGLVAGLAATGAELSGRMLAARQRAARAGGAGAGRPPGRDAAGPAPGDDLHRPARRRGPAGRASRSGSPPRSRCGRWPQALVVEMGGEPVLIAEEDRDLYHAALAGAANHLVTLVVQACDLLAEAGVANPPRMLGPLLGAALDNALRLGDAALTGPVARGDADTVAGHVAALRAAAPEALPAYLALARLTADRALATGMLRGAGRPAAAGRAGREPPR